MNLYHLYENCHLCPRNCGANRLYEADQTKRGFCGQDSRLRVSYIGPHFGEEPPISGSNGSGTVFFSGCSLKCSFCQNYQISKEGLGRIITPEELYKEITGMIDDEMVHNINLVTPDHFYPHIFDLTTGLRKNGYEIPMLYNLSGYQSVEMLKIAKEYADIYMPDFKYSDENLASRLSKSRDYPRIAIAAISEMVRQKGFLEYYDKEPQIAQKGVLVRHLILPGNVENSKGVLDALFLEFGKHIPISLMSQYHPVIRHKDDNMNRRITNQEFEMVYNHALDLGFENLFVQFPEKETLNESKSSVFLPDFRRKTPFEFD